MQKTVGFSDEQTSLNLSLVRSVELKDSNLCKSLLQDGADPNYRPPQGSIRRSAPAFLPRQAQEQRWVRQTRPEGGSVLHLAVQMSTTAVVQLLIAHGAKVNALDELQTHSLHLACMRTGTAATVAALLAVPGCLLDMQDGRHGRTPLHYAALLGDTENFRALLLAGADVTLHDNQRNSVATLCCCASPLSGQKDSECLRILLHRDPELPKEEWQKSLWVAVNSESPSIVRALVDFGVVPSFEAIKQACFVKKNHEVAEVMLKAYKDDEGKAQILFNLLLYTSSKWMIDHRAEENQIHNVARVLLKYIADLDGTLPQNPSDLSDKSKACQSVKDGEFSHCDPFSSPELFLVEHGWVYLAMMYGKLSIAKLLRLAGCDIRKLQILSLISNKTTFETGVQGSLLCLLNEPLSLKQICRKSIRRLFKYNLQQKLKILSEKLVDDVGNYLCMDDLQNVDAFDLCVRTSDEISMDETYAARESSKAAMARFFWVYP